MDVMDKIKPYKLSHNLNCELFLHLYLTFLTYSSPFNAVTLFLVIVHKSRNVIVLLVQLGSVQKILWTF